MKSFLVTAGLVLALALLTGCPKKITLANETGRTLVPYLVVTDPPPPHREPDAGSAIPAGATYAIDPDGFNPVFYAPGIPSQNQPNGVFIGLAMEDEPPVIQYELMHYFVVPGQEGSHAGSQPLVLKSGVVEVGDTDVRITVKAVPLGQSPGAWTVTIAPK